MVAKFFNFASIQRFLSKFPGFSRPDRYSLAFLNSAQFLGALNDNIYKLVLIYFLIDLKGTGAANTILSMAGAIFVIPFLLFSSAAGILADRFSKSRLIMVIKAIEIITLTLATLAFALKSVWGGYALLFLLSTHSAMFGPSKYGIIAELVPKQQISKANGLITSFTYLAIIVGTFLASFLTEISNRKFVLVGGFCVLVAVLGFISSFGIKYTPPKGSKKTLHFFFLKEIYRTLKSCRKRKHLLIAITGSAFFLFVGAFTQLNIIPFALDSLHLREVAGGYLFLATALGIALGATIAGRASKKTIEIGLSCLAGLFIVIMFCLLGLFSHNLIFDIVILFFLGMFGGMFVVPFDSYIQVFSLEEERGQCIAATNFLSFCGVLLASFALYLFNEILMLTSAQSFILMGLLTLGFVCFLFFKISDYAFFYISRKILFPLFRVKPHGFDLIASSNAPLIILENRSRFKIFLLSGMATNLHFLILKKKGSLFSWLTNWSYSFHEIHKDAHEIEKRIKRTLASENIPCLCDKEIKVTEKLKSEFTCVSVHFEKLSHPRQLHIKFKKMT